MSITRITFLCIFPLLAGLHSCREKTEKINPAIESITESVYASGTVKSKGQYLLYSTVNGIIKEVMAKEGDTVKKGAPLLRILNETARLNTENARIAAEYADLRNNTGRLKELRASIDLAQNKLNNDSVLYHRQKNLWSQGIGTRNDLEQRELSLQNSRANHEMAVLRYNELRRQLDFASRQSKKSLQISASQQDDFIIRSESDGRVYRILKEKGESVDLQNPVAVIGDANTFIIELEVDEYDIARIKTGQQVLLTLDSYRGQVFEAVVEKINPLMDDRSRTFIVEAIFTRKPELLFPNLSLEANIIISKKDSAITIPRNYLVEDSFVLMENKERKKVVTGLKDYHKVEITSGLKPTDKILMPGK
ncbi:efflux RND transporter periplasmic adaptor subunit [Flavihumibacter stibioxidans]|uniref:RND transporter n=1 Tax=Flavihumibacter stibioxidans TaxID=1834163 RepID=A0ABR7M656_9BACT|nr:HlyD family efflux transporter periplasmic adaptor subunit [Flavihumibacter stibioxidans]MBC6490504.1 RND transporter [Flavihumibacter stibioxidans]